MGGVPPIHGAGAVAGTSGTYSALIESPWVTQDVGVGVDLSAESGSQLPWSEARVVNPAWPHGRDKDQVAISTELGLEAVRLAADASCAIGGLHVGQRLPRRSTHGIVQHPHRGVDAFFAVEIPGGGEDVLLFGLAERQELKLQLLARDQRVRRGQFLRHHPLLDHQVDRPIECGGQPEAALVSGLVNSSRFGAGRAQRHEGDNCSDHQCAFAVHSRSFGHGLRNGCDPAAPPGSRSTHTSPNDVGIKGAQCRIESGTTIAECAMKRGVPARKGSDLLGIT